MFFTGATQPGTSDGENEDWHAATSDLVVVLDGATIRTDTGCEHGVAWFTRKLGAGIIAGAASRSLSLTQVLADAVRDVAALHPGCDLAHPGTPSAATAIVRLEGQLLRYLVLGDVTIVADTVDGIIVVSDDRVSQTAAEERSAADRHQIGTPEKQAALLAMKHAELAARNRVGGYWIAAADPSAAEHAITGEIDTSKLKRLAVLTDGAARAVVLFKSHTWESALDLIERSGADEFVDQIRTVEAMDPHGSRYPRNKVGDDATVVFATSARQQAGRRSGPTFDPAEQRAEWETLQRRFQRTGGLMGAFPACDGNVYA
jgi:hypothetical protein